MNEVEQARVLSAALKQSKKYTEELREEVVSLIEKRVSSIELTPGPQGEQGPVGPQGEPAPKAEITEEVRQSLNESINTENYLTESEASTKLISLIESFKEELRGPQGEEGEKGESGPAGLSLTEAEINSRGHLVIEMSDGNLFDLGNVTGPQGERGLIGEQGPQGERGDQGLIGPQGSPGPKGERGERGGNFRYSDLTEAQIQEITGPRGLQGDRGEKGDKFIFEDFTPEQIKEITGPVGPRGPQGPQGLSLHFEDLTEEQIKEITGPQGPQGPKGEMPLTQVSELRKEMEQYKVEVDQKLDVAGNRISSIANARGGPGLNPGALPHHAGGGAVKMKELLDVSVTGIANGDALVWDGGVNKFISASSANAALTTATVVISDTAPAAPAVGDLWFENTVTHELFAYDGGVWMSLTGSGVDGNTQLSYSNTFIHSFENPHPTTAANTQSTISTESDSSFSSIRYQVEATTAGGERQLDDVGVTHNSTSASAVIYGTVFTSNTALVEYDASFDASGINLLAKPYTNESITYKIVKTLIKV